MVKVAKKHGMNLALLGGALFFLVMNAASFFGGRATVETTYVPYEVLAIHEAEYYREEREFLLRVTIDKFACTRLPLEENGFAAKAVIDGIEQRVEWRDIDGRPSDENRPPQQSDLNIAVALPLNWQSLEVFTNHACPNADSLEPEIVRTIVYEGTNPSFRAAAQQTVKTK